MKTFDSKILLCTGVILFVASCGLFRPKPIHLIPLPERLPCGMAILIEDTTKYGEDRIIQGIRRYQKNDTLLYEYKCAFGRPEYYPLTKICGDIDFSGGKLYTHYLPSSRSGIFGMNIGKRHPEGIELPGGSALPLYRFQIDTVIRYRYMTSNERKEEVKNDSYRIFRGGRLFTDDWKFYNNNVFNFYCDAAYHYYDERDSIMYSKHFERCSEEYVSPPTENLGMCYFPVEKVKIDYYVGKRLMKRFLGFCIIDDTIKPQYLQEMDTALLALPTKHFMREFLRTERLDCLDGKTFPLPKKQPVGASTTSRQT